jgi:hypothetical protein
VQRLLLRAFCCTRLVTSRDGSPCSQSQVLQSVALLSIHFPVIVAGISPAPCTDQWQGRLRQDDQLRNRSLRFSAFSTSFWLNSLPSCRSQIPCATILVLRVIDVAQGDRLCRDLLQFAVIKVPVPRDIFEQRIDCRTRSISTSIASNAKTSSLGKHASTCRTPPR